MFSSLKHMWSSSVQKYHNTHTLAGAQRCHSYKILEAGSQQVACSRSSHPWGGSIKGKQGSSSTVSSEKHSGASYASWAVSTDTSPMILARILQFPLSKGEKDKVNLETITKPSLQCLILVVSLTYHWAHCLDFLFVSFDFSVSQLVY